MYVLMSCISLYHFGVATIRCSRDVDYLDTNIPQMIRAWFYAVCPLFATVFIVSYSTPIFLVIFVPVAVVFFVIQVGAGHCWTRRMTYDMCDCTAA